MATNERQPKASDDDIVALLDRGIGQSKSFADSKLSKESETTMRYYDGELPKKSHGGDSGYVSMDVYNGVEALGAQLLDIFSTNQRPAVFEPATAEDAQAAEVRTDYVTDVVFRQNEGFQLFQDTIKLGLLNRASVVKAFWEPCVKTEFFELSDSTLQEVSDWLAQHPEAEVEHISKSEDSEKIDRVRLKLKKDVSQVRLKALAPEEFGISPLAEDIKSADLVFHREEKTISELLKMGYPKSVVQDLQNDDRLWMAMESEKLARFQPTDDLIGSRAMDDGSVSRRTVMVYECYIELDLDGTDETQLYKVTKVGNTILEKEPVDRKPFIAFVPLPRAKAFWGHNYAYLLRHVQNAKTYLTRGIVNHTLTTNNPRLLVQKGAVMNPRELMENRFGGLVNVTNIEGVQPLPQSGLNPFVFQTIGLLDSQRDAQTGMSQLSQGLNPDALSKQNSGDMVHELISVSQLRSKIIARNFAENFLRPLYTEVHRLVVENETREKIVRVAGSWQAVTPDQWPEECSMSVGFALGYGEQDKEAAMWLQLAQVLGSVPDFRGLYTQQQKYAVALKVFHAKGIKDTENYLLPPEKAQPVPPDPMQQAEVAMKQADAAAKQASAEATKVAAQFQQQELASKERIHMAQLDFEKMKFEAELQLKKDQLAHKVTVDAAEITLEQQVAAQAQKQSITAVAQPTR